MLAEHSIITLMAADPHVLTNTATLSSPRRLSSAPCKPPCKPASMSKLAPTADCSVAMLIGPATQVEARASLTPGARLLVRIPPDDDDDSNSRSWIPALHVTVAIPDDVRSAADGAVFFRVLWLRGVEALASGQFRASLELPPPWWPLPLGVFATRLGALRAVATAELHARAALRRLVVGRQSTAVAVFPTETQLEQIKTDALAAIDREFSVRLGPQDDAELFAQVAGTGVWDFAAWRRSRGLNDDQFLMEDEAIERIADAALGHEPGHEMWAPRTRLRFYLVERGDLLLPDAERSRQLGRVVRQLLARTLGSAWACWLEFLATHRAVELERRRHAAASFLQRWGRTCLRRWKLTARQPNGGRKRPPSSSLEAIELYRKRQRAAQSMIDRLEREWRRRLGHALQHWADAASLSSPDVQRRLASVRHAEQWHPSHGMGRSGLGVSLPAKLPRVYAHVKPDGTLDIEDAARFREFRARHAGPTAASYWLLRGRVLLGATPERGPAFPPPLARNSPEIAAAILMQFVHVFVGLLDPTDIDDTDRVWTVEREVRRAAAALVTELEGAVRVATRHEELASRELGESEAKLATIQTIRRATKEDVDAAEEAIHVARAKLELAEQNAKAAVATRDHQREVVQQLAFEQFSVAKDAAPAESELLALVEGLEARLRLGESLYVFSANGHGRTGLVAALLLGRLYGLPAREALERAQRCHDCRPDIKPKSSSGGAGSGWASPASTKQVAAVHSILARSTDAMYATVTRENPSERFTAERTQQRGVLAAPFMHSEGFLATPEPDEASREKQQREREVRQRIAAREAAAARRVEQKKREAEAARAMGEHDCDAIWIKRDEEEVADVVSALVVCVMNEFK